MYWILSSVSNTSLPKIIGAISAKQASDILELTYQGNNKMKTIRLQTLKRKFEDMKIKEYETIDQFTTRVLGVVNQLKTHGEDMI